jgi:phosphatidylinositol kinase/protein kinase (PI-3  family)
LKGKEDLRLDERIMQLFSLINKMYYDPSERENYAIKGYSITPISLEIGIIAWV